VSSLEVSSSVGIGIVLEINKVIFDAQSTAPGVVIWIGKIDIVTPPLPDWRLNSVLSLTWWMIDSHPFDVLPGKGFWADIYYRRWQQAHGRWKRRLTICHYASDSTTMTGSEATTRSMSR
jgi:hypothetical protein